MWSILENIPRILEKYILLLSDGMSYKYQLSLMCYLRPVFPYWFSVWMICLSIDENRVLKSSSIIVFLSVSSYMAIMYIEVLLCWVHMYLQLLYLLLGLTPWSLYSIFPCLVMIAFILKSILCDMSITILPFFLISICMKYLCRFSLPVSVCS